MSLGAEKWVAGRTVVVCGKWVGAENGVCVRATCMKNILELGLSPAKGGKVNAKSKISRNLRRGLRGCWNPLKHPSHTYTHTHTHSQEQQAAPCCRSFCIAQKQSAKMVCERNGDGFQNKKKKKRTGVSGVLCTQSAKGNSCICEWGVGLGGKEKAESVEMCYKLNFIETCLKFFVRHFHRFWPPLSPFGANVRDGRWWWKVREGRRLNRGRGGNSACFGVHCRMQTRAIAKCRTLIPQTSPMANYSKRVEKCSSQKLGFQKP